MAATIFSVLPTSDTVNLTTAPLRLVCAVGGNAVIVNAAGTAVTLTSIVAGQSIDLSPVRVNATGTTASLIGVFSE